MKTHKDIEQKSEKWYAIRMGKVTGSKIKRVMGTQEGRTGLIAELIGEEVTEQAKLFKPVAHMERGNEEEGFGIKLFAKRYEKNCESVGIWVSEKYPWLACSPDAAIEGADGKCTEAVEIKCPDTKQSILYRIENMVDQSLTGLISKTTGKPLAGAPFLGIPSEYKWQCVNYFLVNEDLQTLHFVVYDERIIDDLEKLYVVTVSRSNELLQDAIREAEEKLQSFREDWLSWKEIIMPSKF